MTRADLDRFPSAAFTRGEVWTGQETARLFFGSTRCCRLMRVVIRISNVTRNRQTARPKWWHAPQPWWLMWACPQSRTLWRHRTVNAEISVLPWPSDQRAVISTIVIADRWHRTIVSAEHKVSATETGDYSTVFSAIVTTARPDRDCWLNRTLVVGQACNVPGPIHAAATASRCYMEWGSVCDVSDTWWSLGKK